MTNASAEGQGAMTRIRGIARRVSNAAKVLRQPLFAPPGHYLSPVSCAADVDRALRSRSALPGIQLDEPAERALLDRLAEHWAEVPTTRSEGWRYFPENRFFGLADACVYYGMLREFQPGRVVEVGSGFSSAIALDYADRYGRLNLTLIDPFPDRLHSLLHPEDHTRCLVVTEPVQGVAPELFDLSAGDMLFIDSSHVVKVGSDVSWLYLEILPTLRSGVLVHIHDIFWPFEYPEPWLRQGRDWTESYLLRALLTDTYRWRVLFFSNRLWQEEPEMFPPGASPGSIWLVRV